MLDAQKPLPIDATSDILAALNERGICLVDNIIPQDALITLRDYLQIRFRSASGAIYRNSFIKSGSHKFLSYTMLAPHAISIYANKHLISLANAYCGECHLSNHRIFQNLEILPVFGKPMHWHKDNKIDFVDGDGIHKTQMIEDDKGLIMIMYITDIHKGGTQFLSGSHLYHNGQESFNFSETSGFECITLNGIKAGTAVLYDYRTIHRAQPFHRRKHRRIALFSQMSPSFMPKGEPIAALVDELYRLEESQRSFLGFNSQFPTAPNWPLDGKN